MRRAVAVLTFLLGLGLLAFAMRGGEEATIPSAPPSAADDSRLPSPQPLPRTTGGTRELLVQTRVADRAIDVGVEPSCGDPTRTVGGEVLLKGLAEGECTIAIASGDWSAAEQTVELTEPRTVVTFELRKSAWLTVKASAPPSYGPFAAVLSGVELERTARVTTLEGLVLGPVPEGDYLLQLDAEGLVATEEEVELAPGQNTIEVVLREPTRLRGVVRDERGNAVEGARVGTLMSGQLSSDALSGSGGEFALTLIAPGEATVRAEKADVGMVEQRVVTPTEDAVLTLAARGVIEVELFAVDGQRLAAELWVKPVGEGRVVTTSMNAPWPIRIAGLATGQYVIQHHDFGFVPISHQVKVVEGRTTRVRLRQEAGVRLVGRVVDHLGAPVGHVTVAIEGQGDVAATDADGRFTCDGIAPGKVQLYAYRGHEMLSDRVEFTVPRADLVLRLPPPLRVAGTVVDSRGQPVRAFQANQLGYEDNATGRFDVPAPGRKLTIFAEGFAPRVLRGVQGSVGEVVLGPAQFVEGVAVDEAGRPVSGATVSVDEGRDAVTEADGHFRFPLRVVDPEEVVVTRGDSIGRAPVSTREKLRVVLHSRPPPGLSEPVEDGPSR